MDSYEVKNNADLVLVKTIMVNIQRIKNMIDDSIADVSISPHQIIENITKYREYLLIKKSIENIYDLNQIPNSITSIELNYDNVSELIIDINESIAKQLADSQRLFNESVDIEDENEYMRIQVEIRQKRKAMKMLKSKFEFIKEQFDVIFSENNGSSLTDVFETVTYSNYEEISNEHVSLCYDDKDDISFDSTKSEENGFTDENFMAEKTNKLFDKDTLIINTQLEEPKSTLQGDDYSDQEKAKYDNRSEKSESEPFQVVVNNRTYFTASWANVAKYVCEYAITVHPFKMALVHKNSDITINGENAFFRSVVPISSSIRLSNGLQVKKIENKDICIMFCNSVLQYCKLNINTYKIIMNEVAICD